MNSQEFFLNQDWSLFLVLLVSTIFAFIGINYSKKYRGINNYLTANRNVNVISLTTSLVHGYYLDQLRQRLGEE